MGNNAMGTHDLTPEQWDKIEGLLPPQRKAQRGRPAKDNRVMLNAILYWINTGIAWRELPERFGPWQSVYGRLRSWIRRGIWKKVFRVLLAQGLVDDTLVLADSMIANALETRPQRERGGTRDPAMESKTA